MKSDEFWNWYDGFAAPLLTGKLNRSMTFRKMFEYLDRLDHPVLIVETGCIQDPNNWDGNGCSTLLFDKYAQTHRGRVLSVDVDHLSVEIARANVSDCVSVHEGDSIAFLKDVAKNKSNSIDLLYLDASNHDWFFELPSQVHHLNELMAALPALREDSLVAVDDTIAALDDWPQNRMTGKGGLIAEYAFGIPADLVFADYQVGFVGLTRPRMATVGDLESMLHRARSYVESGNRFVADRLYRLILTMTPPPFTSGRVRVARGEAFAHFARSATFMKQYGSAIHWYHQALMVDPLANDYRCEMALKALVPLEAIDAAGGQALVATRVDPNDGGAWETLGHVEIIKQNVAESIKAYDKQVEVTNSDPNALLNRATVALDVEEYDKVRELIEPVFGTKYEGDAWHFLAMTARRESEHEKAIELYDKALAHKCRNAPLAHWHKSEPLLSLGRYKEGFAEHIWGAQEVTVPAFYMPHRRFQKPQWFGKHPPPLRIHVHTEAGHGDNLALIRYLPIMRQMGYDVCYECIPEMVELVKASMPQIEVVPRAKDYPGTIGLKDFDYHVPIGDLPFAFGTDIDTVPWSGPYLKADPELVENYKPAAGLVGLCWTSGIRRNEGVWLERYGQIKSMHFDAVADIAIERDCVSLQVGPERDQPMEAIIDLLPEKPTWKDTAALIANLDLVITVDTAVAHLAGAMGKEVWVMCRRDAASWHWMCWRPGFKWNDKSPWYPSARLFRQHEFRRTPGWSDVVADVVQALRGRQAIAA